MSTQLTFLLESILEEGGAVHLKGQSSGVRNLGLCCDFAAFSSRSGKMAS